MIRLTLLPFLILGLLAGCGDEDPSPSYEGQSLPADILLSGWTPLVQVALNEGDPHWVLLDTGAPWTELDAGTFGIEPGIDEVTGSLDAFGLTFLDQRVSVGDLGGLLGGLLGADIVSHFQLVVDYQGSRAFLFDGVELPAEVGADVRPGESLPAPTMGSGTRVVVDAEIEGLPVSVLIDTGASYVAVDPALLNELGETDRPGLCCQPIVTYQGVVSASLTRLKSVSLGGIGEVGSVVAMQEPASLGLLDALSSETGRSIRALIGGAYLREFLMTVDYQNEQMWLERYNTDDHINRRDYIGPGFELDEVSGEFAVVHVWQDTVAWAEGLRPPEVNEDGDLVIYLLDWIDDNRLAGMSLEQVLDLLHGGVPGTTSTYQFGSPGESLLVDLPIVDLLPDYR